MKACLVRFGVRGFDPILRRAADRLEKLITPERVTLPPLILAEMLRHGAATLSWRANPIDRESPCHALIVLWRIVTTAPYPLTDSERTIGIGEISRIYSDLQS
jgi:hypothetical protein